MPPLCQRYSGEAIVRDDYTGDNSSGGLISSLYQALSPTTDDVEKLAR